MRRLVPLLALQLAATPVLAADPLTDAIARIYPDYRTALFRTNSGPPDAALAAIRATRTAWQGLSARFSQPLPPPYATEEGWPALSTRVAMLLGEAESETMAGRLPAAHEALEEIRDLLGTLRARNGVFTFSDAMNAYHEEMERALPLALEPDERIAELRELAGVLHYLAGRLPAAAPAALQGDAEFTALEAANRAAAEAFRTAVRSGDLAAIRRAAQSLRPAYSRLFLRFG
ncbi:hypothetical protein DFH01_06235 [Falsiroseomonas bella]|uniref:Imelysin-like domain-containing protein n=1 Tax=Falsiroseomonas bella TaxID=2184016 RepID=A0A317FJA2_9PROT|nr:hypothetical protein [Falsiroseomonas bella]PWS38845.1 hypothetical protein DFH01_06235 [Falsiroseomonas bella]